MLSDDQSPLPELIIHGLYESIETNDPFAKEITKLMRFLIGRLKEDNLVVEEERKILESWKLFM